MFQHTLVCMYLREADPYRISPGSNHSFYQSQRPVARTLIIGAQIQKADFNELKDFAVSKKSAEIRMLVHVLWCIFGLHVAFDFRLF